MTGPVTADVNGQRRAALEAWLRTIDATWQQLNAAAIPGRPEPPPHDAGAGPHGSVPLQPNDPRLDLHGAVWAAAVAVAPLYPNGSAHLRHFLDNTGTPMTVNVDDVLRDTPAVATEIDTRLQGELRTQVQRAVDTGQYGVPQTFTVPWFTHNITPEENNDWHYAIGNGEFSVTGVATVHEQPGGPPRVDVDYQVHLYDRYNWDLVEGKQARIFGVLPAPDLVLAQLHQAGIAQEYDSVGTSSTTTYSGEVR
jgi:hypothetical protein